MKSSKDTQENAISSNIFIVSCRRSGTHLLTDLIINNFNYNRINDKLDIDDHIPKKESDKLLETLNNGNNLIWTHSHSYEGLMNRFKDEFKDIFHNSKIIFIYRDVKDIITSYYHRPWQSKSIEELLKSTQEDNYTTKVHNYNDNQNLEDTLIEYQENWFSVLFSKKLIGLDIISISYEEIINEYDISISKISKFLKKDLNKIKDVRLKSLSEQKEDIIYSHNDFRKGCIGDYKELLSDEDIERIDKKYTIKVDSYLKKYFKNKDAFTKTHNYDIRNDFKKSSRDWEKLNSELSNIDSLIDEFNKDSNFNIKVLIDNRHMIFEQKEGLKYNQTIFLDDKYVLKFLLPIKIDIDIEDRDYLYPILSKEKISHFLKSYPTLKDFIPKVHHIGIHNDVFYMIQDRIDDEYLLKDFRSPEKNWKFLYDSGLYKQLITYFNTGLENNICIYDLTYNLENLAVMDNKLLYLDGDGYFYFDEDFDIHENISYKITMEHINNILKINI
jgi:Sulfotransferase domain